MDNVMIDQESKNPAFSFLDDEDVDAYNDENVDPESSQEQSGDDNGKNKPSENTDLQKVMKQNKDLAEIIRQQAERMKELEENSDITTKMRDVLVGDEDKKTVRQKELDDRAKYEDDPYSYMQERNKIEREALRTERMEDMDKYLSPINGKIALRDAQEKINKKYFVDWGNLKVQEKIKKQLDTFSNEYRQNNPVDALVRAAFMAKELRKKLADSLPFIESANGRIIQTGSKKQQDAERKRIVSGIQDAGQKKIFDF